jgi:hypothetical protein
MAGFMSAIGCLIRHRMSDNPQNLGHWAFDADRQPSPSTTPEPFTVAATGIPLWLFTLDMIFLLITASAVFRVFTKDSPEQPTVAITSYFIMVLAGLAWIVLLMPGKEIGR